MTDRNTVIPILQRLQNEAPLDPDPTNPAAAKTFAELYVDDLHAAHGDVALRLATEVELSVGSRHAYLFSGTIGSGKSTELRRLAKALRESGHHPVVVNIMEYLNPQLPVGIADLLMAMAMGVWEGWARQSGRDPDEGKRLAWWQSLLAMRPEGTELEISGGFLKLKMALSANPTFRERLRQHFEASLDTLVESVNDFFAKLAEEIRNDSRLGPHSKLVVIIDSLEHFGGQSTPGQVDEVLQSLLRMFNTFNAYLRLDAWTAIYSVPPLLHKLAPGIAASFGMASTYYLTSAHVFQDRSDAPDEDTIQNKMLPLLTKRLGLDDPSSIIGTAQLRDIILNTGGDLRDLLRTLRAALLAGLTSGFPVSQAQLERVYNELRRPYLPFPKDSAERLQQIRRDKEARLETAADWQWVISDLAQKRVLLYLNGTEWYDVHPLLRKPLEAQFASSSSAP
ncbi:MAG: hypothetical protein RIR00_812 [Pseudomonadota bacterium]|jgi:energy-coupling factor transporter ATP-binding protein EcfA2